MNDKCERLRHTARDLIFGRTAPASTDTGKIALTFDDGPNDPYTLRLLELLDRYQVHASFFLIGEHVHRRPDIVRAIHKAGHLLGNHTMTHPSLLWASPRRVRDELTRCNTAIEDATGEAVHWFRPPFGARRPDVLQTARRLGLSPIMWNVWGRDWEATHPGSIIDLVQNGILHNQQMGRSSNVLLHDGGPEQMGTDRSVTLAATDSLLKAWTAERFQLVSLQEQTTHKKSASPMHKN